MGCCIDSYNIYVGHQFVAAICHSLLAHGTKQTQDIFVYSTVEVLFSVQYNPPCLDLCWNLALAEKPICHVPFPSTTQTLSFQQEKCRMHVRTISDQA